jgi:hypothetical protein
MARPHRDGARRGRAGASVCGHARTHIPAACRRAGVHRDRLSCDFETLRHTPCATSSRTTSHALERCSPGRTATTAARRRAPNTRSRRRCSRGGSATRPQSRHRSRLAADLATLGAQGRGIKATDPRDQASLGTNTQHEMPLIWPGSPRPSGCLCLRSRPNAYSCCLPATRQWRLLASGTCQALRDFWPVPSLKRMTLKRTSKHPHPNIADAPSDQRS